MNKILVKNIFAAVFEKSSLDPILEFFSNSPISSLKPGFEVRFWGTKGTVDYVKGKGFAAESVIRGFEYGGRVKSLDRENFVRILADRTKPDHLKELKKERIEPIDLVIVDLYAPNQKSFPESMDIGGQALVRAAVKNYKNVALAFNRRSIGDLTMELNKNSGSTTLKFRREQAKKALAFIAQRCRLESKLLETT